jgi:uncharacterized membrane protein
MELFLYTVAQLTLVTLVYIMAYRTGYQVSQAKVAGVVKDFAAPVSDLLEELNEAVDKVLEDENKKKRSDKT